MIRVVLFDDNKSIRQSLGLYLASTDDIFFCGAFPDANEALAKIRRHQPDVVLMDIQMPGISGLEALQQIKPPCPTQRC
jgi:CheY-like chemotaxis protein